MDRESQKQRNSTEHLAANEREWTHETKYRLLYRKFQYKAKNCLRNPRETRWTKSKTTIETNNRQSRMPLYGQSGRSVFYLTAR